MGTKPNIYTVNNTSTTVATGNNLPLGRIVRKYSNCLNLNDTAIEIGSEGYYSVNFNATLTGAVGAVSVALYQDNIQVPGAISTANIATATTEPVGLIIPAIIRVRCCNRPSQLTFVLTGTDVSFSNIAVSVEKI